MALYSEDSLYYEATILSVDEDARTAYVRFDYYENEEEVNMEELLPVECKADLQPATDDVYCNESEVSCKTEDEKPSDQSQDEGSDCKVKYYVSRTILNR